MTAKFLYFNTTLAKCENVTADFRPQAESSLVESVFTRYSAREVCRSFPSACVHCALRDAERLKTRKAERERRKQDQVVSRRYLPKDVGRGEQQTNELIETAN